MLDDVKKLLGLADSENDELLESIISLTEQRLLNLLGGADEIPSELSYIVTEVAVKRFNRIGSEGLSSHTLEGESLSWSDDDFDVYEGDIQDFIDRQEEAQKGRVRFL